MWEILLGILGGGKKRKYLQNIGGLSMKIGEYWETCSTQWHPKLQQTSGYSVWLGIFGILGRRFESRAAKIWNYFKNIGLFLRILGERILGRFERISWLRQITITTLAAHAVIWEGLINMFWFRDLLTNNCIQPRAANVAEGRALTLSPH